MARRSSAPSDLSALSGVAPELAAAFASLTGDVALVIDGAGVIREAAVCGAAADHPAASWVGRSWAETVTGDTRRKIELLLEETGGPGVTRRREVNHPSQEGVDIPMSYAALRLGLDGPVLAVGRDLRGVAAIQQRFVEAQHEMERDYWKLRQQAARQRMLAEVATDAVLVVDAQSLAVHDSNAAGEAMFGPGAPVPAAMRTLLAEAGRSGRPAEARMRLPLGGGLVQVDLSVTPFRVGGAGLAGSAATRLLVRARSASVDGTSRDGESVVVTDSSGRVMVANAAFRVLCRRDDDAVEGQPVGELLGDPERQLAALLVEARRGGLVRRPLVRLGGGRVPVFECMAQAVLMTESADQECLGLTLVPVALSGTEALRTAMLSLLEQTGEVPLPEMVRRMTEMTERHAVETAMRRASDDPHAAAALLGLSADDLAERLARFGLTR